VILIAAAWLAGWYFGETAALRQLLNDRIGAPRLFLAAWLTIWTIGGGWAAFLFLWTAVGKEVVWLRPGTLTIRREVLGIGLRREYDLGSVRNLRVAPVPVDPFRWESNMRVWGMGGGCVAFDYGAKTYRFGLSVDESEAARIVEDLKARHPFVAGPV
jgi:hypothetical protein